LSCSDAGHEPDGAYAGMSATGHHGISAIDAGGELLIGRGTQFHNSGTMTSNGHISIKDGGSAFERDGSIVNNGTIDSYTTAMRTSAQ
jgi:hypothetical protein